VLSSHKRLIAPVGVALLLQVLVENGDSLLHAKELSLGQLCSIQSIESGLLNRSSGAVSPLDYDLAVLDIKMVKKSGIPNGKYELVKKGIT